MKKPTIAIIGSGFSGMGAAIKLKKELGIIAQIYEGTSEIGGTWNYNTYPGCACDVPSHLYSFSFEKNPNWSQKFSPQKEIHDYMKGVARKYGIYEQTQFETSVLRASWIEEKRQWELELLQHNSTVPQIVYYDFIFCCVGGLRVPHVPEQFKAFEGKIIHSSSWDNDYDFTNKTVAVIGSGTSAIQIVPNLAPKVKHLYSYQRTPSWVAPREQYSYSKFIKFVFAYIPFAMLIYRAFLFLRSDLIRFQMFRNANSRIAKIAKEQIRNHMRHVFVTHNKPDLADKLIPDFPVGCKRIGISDDYLQSLCADNVTVNCTSINKVHGRTIETIDGQETEVDVLVLATGFNTGGFLGELQLYGRNQVHLNSLWETSIPKSFKTVSVHGFPNLFMTLGPFSGLGHNSVVTIIESQIDYCVDLIKYTINSGSTCIDAKEKAQEQFATEVMGAFEGTAWKGGCKSWYITESGQVRSLWPYNVLNFMKMLKNTDFNQSYVKA